MAYEVGDPGHLSVHGDLVTRLSSLGIVWGVTLTLPDVPTLGESGHVPDHDLIVAAIRELHAAQVAAGALVDPLPPLPDAAAVGDLGHVDDHNLIESALVVCEAGKFPYNEATGGTVTYYTDGEGQAWARHTLAPTDSEFVVTTAVDPFRVLWVAAGGQGGSGFTGGIGHNGYQGAGGGAWTDDARTIPVGSHPVTVGAGRTAQAVPASDGWGESTVAFGVTCGGGARSGYTDTSGGPGGAGTPGSEGGTSNGGTGGHGVIGPTNPQTDPLTAWGITVTDGPGFGGYGTGQGSGGAPGTPGFDGVVIVDYRVASIPGDYVEVVEHPTQPIEGNA